MYKHLLWDVDGTVLDFNSAEKYAMKTLFAKYNLGEIGDEKISLYSKINTKYWQMLERGELSKSEVLIGRFIEFFETTGVDTSIAERFNLDYQVTLGDHIEFIDNAKEILLSVKGKYVISAVTNGTKRAQQKKLYLSGLDKIFDAIFISEDIGFEKPNRQYFEIVFDNLVIKDKSEVLIIGDSLSSDMKGGYDMGIDTCWFNPSKKVNSLNIPVTYEIDNLSKIYHIIGGENNV